jgi:hypothetical protein
MVGRLIDEIQVRIGRRLFHDQHILSQCKHSIEFVTPEFLKATPTELHRDPRQSVMSRHASMRLQMQAARDQAIKSVATQ